MSVTSDLTICLFGLFFLVVNQKCDAVPNYYAFILFLINFAFFLEFIHAFSLICCNSVLFLFVHNAVNITS